MFASRTKQKMARVALIIGSTTRGSANLCCRFGFCRPNMLKDMVRTNVMGMFQGVGTAKRWDGETETGSHLRGRSRLGRKDSD